MKKKFLLTFIALGIVSLLADITYEGGRSISGAYLNLLRAPPVSVGVLALGELLSYLMRLLGGIIAHKVRSGLYYWFLVFLGYSTNLAIPLLSITGRWEFALGLYLIERLGKGLRAPARDVIISEVTEGMGRGKGFGIHEVMDQVGAILGPTIVGVSIATQQNVLVGYRLSFSILGIPAILALVSLFIAYRSYPSPRAVTITKPSTGPKLSRSYWLYTIASLFVVLGFLHWGLITYHAQNLSREGVIEDWEVPILYLIAMFIDALVALPIGFLYDRIGLKSMTIVPLTALPITPLLFEASGKYSLYLTAMIWGLTMGMIETIMRASIADLAPPEIRSLAYGVYSSLLGLLWFIGSTITSYLYQVKIYSAIIILSIGAELIALTIYVLLLKYSTHPIKASL